MLSCRREASSGDASKRERIDVRSEGWTTSASSDGFEICKD